MTLPPIEPTDDADTPDEDAEHVLALHEVTQTAAVGTVKQRLPYESTNRVMEYLERSSSPEADLYAMFRTWLHSWRHMVTRVAGDLTPEEFWDVAERHRLFPGNGAELEARRLVGAFLLRVLGDEELRMRIEGGTDLETASCEGFAFYYDYIFRPGPDMQRACVFIVLFMVKSAFVDVVRE